MRQVRARRGRYSATGKSSDKLMILKGYHMWTKLDHGVLSLKILQYQIDARIWTATHGARCVMH